MQRIESYREFWPYYLKEHSQPLTRTLHAIGTGLGLTTLAAGIAFRSSVAIPVALTLGYGFAWASHFWVEKNRPATFQYPLWSFISDFRLFFLTLTRRL